MRKSSTILFVIFLTLVLVSLASINAFRNIDHLKVLPDSVVTLVSVILVLSVLALFLYREAENKKIQGQFIAIVTHKFRTPLTGIRWTIDMLQKDLTLLEKKDLLMEMQKANERLMEIVDLLVGYAHFDRKLEYAFAAISLREIVGVSVNKYSALAKSKNIQFQINSDRELPMVITDKAKIQFVVDMLIDNALKYTPSGGTITASFTQTKKSITLAVTDTGIGMNFLDRHRIFGHFYRSKSAKLMDTEGLGLGLYTARNIVRYHHGKLWPESKGPNKGSTFYLRLPIKR